MLRCTTFARPRTCIGIESVAQLTRARVAAVSVTADSVISARVPAQALVDV